MKIAIIKERSPVENRVAVSPEIVAKLAALGADITLENGAGEGSHFSDNEYIKAGATLSKDVEKILNGADVLLKVQPPFEKIGTSNDEADIASLMKKGSIYIGLLDPYGDKEKFDTLLKNHITAFSMELIPRISRAQNMDVLSSQSNLAGYKAVLDAVSEFHKVLPMMMTAAGTIRPAKVLVLGAGVAGLQAIATAKRLGAVVSAFDVRPVVKEQVESLGATFIEVPAEESEAAETSGGYAKEMSEDYKKKQNALVEETLKTQDIVITTALIPGRPAPELISEKMVKSMKDGSVIVDLAAINGGNCALTQKGETVVKHGVTIMGHENIVSRVADDASALYARNLFNFLNFIYDKEAKKIQINHDDDIIKGCLVTHKGVLVHPSFASKKAEAPAKEKQTTKKPTPVKKPPKKVLEKKPHLKKKTKAAVKKAAAKKPVTKETEPTGEEST